MRRWRPQHSAACSLLPLGAGMAPPSSAGTGGHRELQLSCGVGVSGPVVFPLCRGVANKSDFRPAEALGGPLRLGLSSLSSSPLWAI